MILTESGARSFVAIENGKKSVLTINGSVGKLWLGYADFEWTWQVVEVRSFDDANRECRAFGWPEVRL